MPPDAMQGTTSNPNAIREILAYGTFYSGLGEVGINHWQMRAEGYQYRSFATYTRDAMLRHSGTTGERLWMPYTGEANDRYTAGINALNTGRNITTSNHHGATRILYTSRWTHMSPPRLIC